ncbi:MAG: SEC-C domain-containing protein [Candidatus Hydrogenedentes bacterium]|nr:SEC-C domain-containing protein [Candidatus Hydrogenedentota bacterium]
MAEKLVMELGDEDWRDLYERFYKLKQAQTENVSCGSLIAAFPSENMSDPSLMVAYKEIFPWGNAFDFKREQELWLIDDQHCVNPACDCQNAVVTFLRTAVSSHGRAKVAQEMSPARYDVERDVFEALQPPWTDTPRLEVLVNALRDAHPTVARDMRNRRLQLRTLYQVAVNRERPKMPPRPVQRRDIRPNDHCPCGSGLKFKKCCGKFA